MTIDFNSIRATIFDMDGVLWRGSEPLPGIPEFFEFLQSRNIAFSLATNNSTKTVEMYVDRLVQIGIPAKPEHVVTSSVATADYISRRYPTDTPIYIIGSDGIRQAMAERGYCEDPDHARLVIVGMDFEVTYAKFKIATLRIRAGADFIGTNADRTFPLPVGLVPGNGSLLALLETATDKAPLVIGKPEAAMYEVSLLRMGVSPEHTLMIGDRLETDILGAQRAGLPAALVLTGTTSAEQAHTSEIRADGIFQDLPALQAAWTDALAR